MMLKDNSGMPPPRISSRPGTPVGNLRIVTLAGWLTTFFRSLRLVESFFAFIFVSIRKTQNVEEQCRPCLANQLHHQIFANESPEQFEQLGENSSSSRDNRLRVNLRFEFGRSRQRAIRFDMRRAQPRNFRSGQHERARQEHSNTGVSHEGRQKRMQLLRNRKGRQGYWPGRFIFPRLMSNKTPGEFAHLRSGPAHLQTPSQSSPPE